MKIKVVIIFAFFLTIICVVIYVYQDHLSTIHTSDTSITPFISETPTPSPTPIITSCPVVPTQINTNTTQKATPTSNPVPRNSLSKARKKIDSATVIPTPTKTKVSKKPLTPTQSANPSTSDSTLIYKDFEYSISHKEVTIVKYLKNEEEVVVPTAIDGFPVTTIGSGAFCYVHTSTEDQTPASDVEVVTLPESIKRIEHGAFNMCTNLKTINLPEGLTYIGKSAFSECESLANPILPSSLKCIENHAFCLCFRLGNIVIPEGITTIEEYTFEGCGIASITLPSTLITIEAYAFDSSSISSIDIPEGVTTIEEWAFHYCTYLQSVTIPDSVIHIGSQAFWLTPWLNNLVNTESLANINGNLLMVKTNDTEYSIPSDVRIIGDYAFDFCDNLNTITIPKSVVSISHYALPNCSNLTIITTEDSYASEYAKKHNIKVIYQE